MRRDRASSGAASSVTVTAMHRRAVAPLPVRRRVARRIQRLRHDPGIHLDQLDAQRRRGRRVQHHVAVARDDAAQQPQPRAPQ